MEGYDASRVAPSLKEPLDYLELLRLIRNQPENYDFVGNLDDIAGYDLVFLDFNNGTDNLQRNAALFEQVLGWVNQTKAGNSNPQNNVVLGLSMGGMITRYALANLTKQNISTGTRLLISHDSPHQGANTPLGLQYMTRFLASRGGIGGMILNELDIVRQGNELLDEPASAELLIYKALSPTTFAANTFLGTTYRNMVTFAPTDPQPAYKFIAIASGSECGVPLFAAGEDIVNVNGATFAGLPFFPFAAGEVRISARIRSLPSSGQSTNIAHLEIKRTISLFFGLINRTAILESFDAFSPSGALPWDGAPGGTVDVAKKLGDNNSRNLIVPLGLSVTAASFTLKEKVSFVSTTSALDITNVTAAALTASYVGGISPGNPSRAENFKAQEPYSGNGSTTLFNKEHRFFTARNANWLFNEMEGITPNDLNCSTQCQPAGFTITGDDAFCNSATYTYIFSPGTPINWSIFPTGMVSVSGNTNPLTLTRIQDGIVYLTASTVVCGINKTVTKKIIVGSPAPDGIYFDPEEPLCINERYPRGVKNAYVLNPVYGAIYEWRVNNIVRGSGNPHLNIIHSNCVIGTNTITVRAFICGVWSTETVATFEAEECEPEGFRMYSVSPNPSYGSVSVESKSTKTIDEIRVKDKLGNVKLSRKSVKGAKKLLLDLSLLPADIYFIEIFDGKEWHIEKVIKN